jgi:arylsulfatase A-like enzyme
MIPGQGNKVRLLKCARARALLLALSMAGILGCTEATEVERNAPYFELATQRPEVSDSLGGDRPAAKIDFERRTIWLPSAAEISYLLELEADSTFETRDVMFRGDGVRLEIDLEADGLGIANLISLEESRPSLAVPLDLPDNTPVRLTVRVRPTNGSEGGGVLIREPEIWSARDPSESESTALDLKAPSVEQVASRPNVMIYLIDTLRGDRLGIYGNQRDVSPNIDEFALQATLFEHVVSQSSWTKASVASIFTGMWPPAHGAIGWKHMLADGLPTLAEVLEQAGYQTAAVSGNPNVVKAYGMDQGFQDFYRLLKRTSEQINQKAFEWLDQRDLERPFLLYVHTMDPHAPYQPPEPFRGRLAPDSDQMPQWQPSWKWPLEALPYLSDLYDAEIAFNDDSFGRMLEELRSRDLFENTLVVLISDHGEELKEHGRWRHGATLYSESLEVPMIVRYPGQSEGRRVAVPVQQIDVMPTILDALELGIPDTVQGRSLLSLKSASVDDDHSPIPKIYSHLKLGKSPLFHSVVDGDWKLIRTERPEGVTLELFNWRADPKETENLIETHPIRAAWMDQVIEQKLAISVLPLPTEDAVVDPEIEEALEALGYLD